MQEEGCVQMFTPNVAVYCFELVLYIPEAPSSKLGSATDYTNTGL
jgi:hypothetical protein